MPKRVMCRLGLAISLVAALLAGCATSDTILMAERGQGSKPGFAETRAIAEEGFIYGLAIVMNYAVMYEYIVDKNSGQWKAPFNTIFNEHRVFTYQDTTIVTPNSDTPYSLLWLDFRAEPFVLSVPAVEKARYYALMLCDGNAFNYGYIGSRATGIEPGDYLVVGPVWTGATPPGIKNVFRSTTQFSLSLSQDPAVHPLLIATMQTTFANLKPGYEVTTVFTDDHAPIEWVVNDMVIRFILAGGAQYLQ